MTTEWLNTLSIIMLLIGFYYVTKSIRILHDMLKILKVSMEIQTMALGKHILTNQRSIKEHIENDH